MQTRLVVLVTLLPMLVHSILGCCWHHAHFDHVDVCAAPRVQAAIHRHQCTHHHCSKNASAEASASPVPAPCRHHAPCDEVSCVFLDATLLRVAVAFELTAKFVAPEENWTVTLRGPLKSLRCLAASREMPTSQEHCALIQVWIV